MKKRNLALVFSVTLLLLVGISLVNYDKDIGFYISGSVVFLGCSERCSDEVGSGLIDPGTCSESWPLYCPNNNGEGECGTLVENCGACGCDPHSEQYGCQDSGSCEYNNSGGDTSDGDHTECFGFDDGEYYYCMVVPGEGINECGVSADCYPEENNETVWHSVCSNKGACQSFLGPGRDQCDLDGCLDSYLNKCDDYTWEGECAINNLPSYCSGGVFVNDCQTCGCPNYLEGESICNADGSCTYSYDGGSGIDSLVNIADGSIDFGPQVNPKFLFKNQAALALKFKRYEMPFALKFIGPFLYDLTQKLPPKPELSISEGIPEVEGAQGSPADKVLNIRGLKILPEEIKLSPGERSREWELILKVREGIPYIDVHG
jgi:hypothetical protein